MHYELATHSRKPVPAFDYPDDHSSFSDKPKQQFLCGSVLGPLRNVFKRGLYQNKVEKADNKKDSNDTR